MLWNYGGKKICDKFEEFISNKGVKISDKDSQDGYNYIWICFSLADFPGKLDFITFRLMFNEKDKTVKIAVESYYELKDVKKYKQLSSYITYVNKNNSDEDNNYYFEIDENNIVDMFFGNKNPWILAHDLDAIYEKIVDMMYYSDEFYDNLIQLETS